jgi:hypothetical protein
MASAYTKIAYGNASIILQNSRLRALVQADDTASRDNEYSRYIKERVKWVEDPIAWGLLQKHRYPNLSQISSLHIS